jgi:hypothetical protein
MLEFRTLGTIDFRRTSGARIGVLALSLLCLGLHAA